MKITTQEQLIDYLISNYRNYCGNYGKLYVASKKHKSVDVLELDSQFTIGRTVFSDSPFIFYGQKFQQRSLIDMNIPENNYNDWYCFTTPEEADEYISPKKFVVNRHYCYNETYASQADITDRLLVCRYVQADQAVLSGESGDLYIHTLEDLRLGYINEVWYNNG